jgi:hypothetical protein
MTPSETSALAHQGRHLLNIEATVRYMPMNCRSFEKSECRLMAEVVLKRNITNARGNKLPIIV